MEGFERGQRGDSQSSRAFFAVQNGHGGAWFFWLWFWFRRRVWVGGLKQRRDETGAGQVSSHETSGRGAQQQGSQRKETGTQREKEKRSSWRVNLGIVAGPRIHLIARSIDGDSFADTRESKTRGETREETREQRIAGRREESAAWQRHPRTSITSLYELYE